jgi:hypothetical protein
VGGGEDALSSVLVLEDALLERRDELPSKLLPDELDPLFLVSLGCRLGGDAASVAELVFEELGGVAQFAPFDPVAIHLELCRRRGYEGELFTGLLIEEVESACRFHAASLAQLQAVGLLDDPNAEDWERLRTLYQGRDGIFQIFQDGKARWVLPDSNTARGLKKPVQSRIRRSLVLAPPGRRIDPKLKPHGWRPSDEGLLRDRLWHEHSRRSREVWESRGPQQEHHAHLWKDTDDGQFSQCKRCGVWRYFSTLISVYRYATGDRAQAELAQTRGVGRLRSPPRCVLKEGT